MPQSYESHVFTILCILAGKAVQRRRRNSLRILCWTCSKKRESGRFLSSSQPLHSYPSPFCHQHGVTGKHLWTHLMWDSLWSLFFCALFFQSLLKFGLMSFCQTMILFTPAIYDRFVLLPNHWSDWRDMSFCSLILSVRLPSRQDQQMTMFLTHPELLFLKRDYSLLD